jgi:hypothetical protein
LGISVATISWLSGVGARGVFVGGAVARSECVRVREDG